MSLQTAPCALRASRRLTFTLALCLLAILLRREMLFFPCALPTPTPRAPGPQVQLGALQMSWQPEGGLASFKMAVPTNMGTGFYLSSLLSSHLNTPKLIVKIHAMLTTPPSFLMTP